MSHVNIDKQGKFISEQTKKQFYIQTLRKQAELISKQTKEAILDKNRRNKQFYIKTNKKRQFYLKKETLSKHKNRLSLTVDKKDKFHLTTENRQQKKRQFKPKI